MDENIILDWKEANTELYSKFKHDLEEQLQKPYHQTILDISDGNAEPLQMGHPEGLPEGYSL